MLTNQIAESIKNIGPEKTVSIMSLALCYMAQSASNDLEFECDFGVVTVERKMNALYVFGGDTKNCKLIEEHNNGYCTIVMLNGEEKLVHSSYVTKIK